MPTNQAFTLNYKNQNNYYIPIELKTTREQVATWNYNDIYKNNIITLSKDSWNNNVQTISVNNIMEINVPYIFNILSGDTENMKKQNIDFQKISGVSSKKGQVIFTCSAIPEVDLQIQLYWTT